MIIDTTWLQHQIFGIAKTLKELLFFLKVLLFRQLGVVVLLDNIFKEFWLISGPTCVQNRMKIDN